MSFHVNAEELHINDDGHILLGKLPNEDGDLVEAEIDLNECLGNNDGQFEWGGQDFRGSADNVHFDLIGEDEDQIAVLHAELSPVEGEPVTADVNLAERIANDNGTFAFR